VEKIGDPPLPRSRAPVLLIKDVAFLVLFGILAISIAQAAQLPDLTKFLRRSIVFLLAGFAWSPVDYAARWLWAKCRPAEHFEFDNVGAFWRIWVWLDLIHAAVMLVLFWLIRSIPGAATFVAAAIVVVNIAFLVIDFTKMIAATRPPAPAAPAA
jgi:hypothetical protein